MATLLPPLKRARLSHPAQEPVDLSAVTGNVLCQFRASDTGEVTGMTMQIPARTTTKELELLLNQLLNNVCSRLDESSEL
jgi:NLE (NUC135) domain